MLASQAMHSFIFFFSSSDRNCLSKIVRIDKPLKPLTEGLCFLVDMVISDGSVCVLNNIVCQGRLVVGHPLGHVFFTSITACQGCLH